MRLPACRICRPVVKISKNGAAFVNVAGTVSDTGDGWYAVTLTAAETNTEGPLVVRATHSDTFEWRDIHQVTAGFPALLSDAEVQRLATALATTLATTKVSLEDANFNRIADHVLRRQFGAVAASNFGDEKSFRSLLGSVAKNVNRVVLDGRTLTIYEADDQTPLGVQAVAVNDNPPAITALDTEE